MLVARLSAVGVCCAAVNFCRSGVACARGVVLFRLPFYVVIVLLFWFYVLMVSVSLFLSDCLSACLSVSLYLYVFV